MFEDSQLPEHMTGYSHAGCGQMCARTHTRVHSHTSSASVAYGKTQTARYNDDYIITKERQTIRFLR